MTKILVAEDERDIRELVVDTLFDKGYDILESKDGREAVDIAFKEAPDLILLDVTMPFPDGFAVVKKLNREHSHRVDTGGDADGHGCVGQRAEPWIWA